jgi:hypothetical protein
VREGRKAASLPVHRRTGNSAAELGQTGEATTMIALDIFAAALVTAMLSAMLNEDTRDSRIRIARL